MSNQPDRFDPRKHSSLLLNYNEKLNCGASLNARCAELPVKTFVVGPHHSAGPCARPASAPANGRSKDPCSPRFMDNNGRWVQGAFEDQLQASVAQPVVASGTMTAKVANSVMPQKSGYVCPVSAVFSYGDVSPVVTAEHVREAGGYASMTYTAKEATGRSSPRSVLDNFSPSNSPKGGGHTSRPTSAYTPAHTQAQNRSQPGQPKRSATPNQRQYSPLAQAVVPGLQQRRPVSAPRERASNAKPASPYVTFNMTVDKSGSQRIGSARPAARTGTVPANTGHWTGLESQANTMLKSGKHGVPLDHPFHLGNSGNIAPWQGGQYTMPDGYETREYHYNDSRGGHDDDYTIPARGHGGYKTNYMKQALETPYAAAASNAFWPLSKHDKITPKDLKRTDELGKGVVAGSPNSKLIGGKWKYLPRPVEGDVVYTDYYGPYGEDHANYYGRSYNINSKEFSQHRLVNDSDYQKVRASMMGIQALRDRPGLSLGASVVHGLPSQLNKLTQYNAGKTMAQLHHIDHYANLQPDHSANLAY